MIVSIADYNTTIESTTKDDPAFTKAYTERHFKLTELYRKCNKLTTVEKTNFALPPDVVFQMETMLFKDGVKCHEAFGWIHTHSEHDKHGWPRICEGPGTGGKQ